MIFFNDEKPGTRVKICGLTCREDAELAVEAGADALGFNLFSGSKRCITWRDEAAWIGSLAGRVARVAVVVNASFQEACEAWESGLFEAIQFHGDETREFCAAFGENGRRCFYKAVRPRSASDAAAHFGGAALLLDAWVAGEYGGTGARLDLDLVRAVQAAQPTERIILAGGLNAGNAGDVVRAVRPWAVDVASGVEGADPRRKDVQKMRAFVAAVRGA